MLHGQQTGCFHAAGARRLCERNMLSRLGVFGVQERFKVCERENKTKAFSKVQASSAAPFSRLLVYRKRCKLMNTCKASCCPSHFTQHEVQVRQFPEPVRGVTGFYIDLSPPRVQVGLLQDDKVDPAEVARHETTEWLNRCHQSTRRLGRLGKQLAADRALKTTEFSATWCPSSVCTEGFRQRDVQLKHVAFLHVTEVHQTIRFTCWYILLFHVPAPLVQCGIEARDPDGRVRGAPQWDVCRSANLL